MHVNIATAPCSWGVWYTDGKPSGTPYVIFLDQAAAAGYSALELGPVGYLPTDPTKLAYELESRSLSICAGTACYALDRASSLDYFRDELDKLCSLLVQFKAPYVVVMDASDIGPFGEKKKYMTREDRLKYVGIVREMAKLTMNNYGIDTVFHPHVGTLFEYENEIEELIDLADVNLCFDTGHHAYSNGGFEKGDNSALDFMLKYPERIAYLHFKNVDGAIRRRVELEGLTSSKAFDMNVMCDLEDGIIDFVELKKVLNRINFNGIGVIEQDMPHATTEQAFATAKKNLEYLKSIHII
jgi:inosose dehydratase